MEDPSSMVYWKMSHHWAQLKALSSLYPTTALPDLMRSFRKILEQNVSSSRVEQGLFLGLRQPCHGGSDSVEMAEEEGADGGESQLHGNASLPNQGSCSV